MELVFITLPKFFDGETSMVNRLFSIGMQHLHLRKPAATQRELAQWIENIDEPYRQRIVLHDYHELALEYSLGGIHLNSRNPLPLKQLTTGKGHRLTVSRSCHSLNEVVKYKGECDYLFLSPIFDSISKEGYGAAFTPDVLRKAFAEGIIDNKVYALGGVSSDHLPEIGSHGFGGAAILGDLWLCDNPENKLRLYISSKF